jgi:copper chaperone CopZ|tara:strand:+ start:3765 stop:4448 length:684 start_codon:yes stop_codon:yes gene_type:complete
MKMKKLKDKNYLWAGIIGGFTAATCCIAPIVLILLGFGTALGMAVMHQFHIVSIVSGIILMLLLSLYLIKRKSGICNIKTIKQSWKGIAIAIIIMIVSWAIINYFLVSLVASMVYGNLEVKQKPLGNLKEMTESHDMPGMADMGVMPEGEGKKLIVLKIEGIFCGSCGPALVYDIKSILGVLSVEQSGSRVSVTYDSNITSKKVIIASIHDPYSAKIISEKKYIEYG